MRACLIAALALLATGAGAPHPAAAQERLMVFAAASLKNALDDVDAAFTQKTGMAVVASYGASSALIKQIEAGAPADVFLSADQEWTDYGAQIPLGLRGGAVRAAEDLDLLGVVDVEEGESETDGREVVDHQSGYPQGLLDFVAVDDPTLVSHFAEVVFDRTRA